MWLLEMIFLFLHNSLSFLFFTIFFLSLPGKGKPLDTDSGAITNSTEEEHLLEMGKPRLGEVTKTKIYIKESQEFKVLCQPFKS